MRLSRETVPQGLNSLRTISRPLLINPNIARALLQHFSQSQTQGLPIHVIQTDKDFTYTSLQANQEGSVPDTPSTQAFCVYRVYLDKDAKKLKMLDEVTLKYI